MKGKDIDPSCKYNNNLIYEFLKTDDSKVKFDVNILKSNKNTLTRYIKETMFLIEPNPTSNLTFICYRHNDWITHFTVFDTSKECMDNLERQYNKSLDKEFLDLFDFDSFIKTLRVYKEVNKTSNNVLLSDGNIYDYNNMIVTKEVIDLPSVYADNYGYSELTVDEKQIVLDNLKAQYPIHKDFIFFLTYVYCTLNKEDIKQSIFVNIDESGVGKSSKIMFSVVLGLNKIADKGLLKSTELYNLSNINTLFVNETQNKTIDGSTLNNLADSTPLTVTRKSDSAITIRSEDKPLIVLLGENLPMIQQLSNGTNRRFYLVPKISSSFNIDRDINIMYKEFSDIMYGNKPLGVLLYYLELFKEYEIKENLNQNISDMSIGIKELTELIENPHTIFNKYFNLNPTNKSDIKTTYYCIGTSNSLDKLLKLINETDFKSNHYLDIHMMKKDLHKYIKSNCGLSNIKDLGSSTISIGIGYENIYYSISITEYAKKIIDLYNEDHKEKIYYKDVNPLQK